MTRPSFGLETFASFEPGDAVVLMGAQRGLETLEAHPQNVMGSEGLARGTAGCLVVYCAGCALKIEARLQRVAEAFSYSLERPFVGIGLTVPTESALWVSCWVSCWAPGRRGERQARRSPGMAGRPPRPTGAFDAAVCPWTG